MAGVLNALASYVTKMLADMAREEVAMMIGVSGGIDDLSVKLGDLENFLADADRRNITDESVQRWVDELKRAMYHATDILDLCQLKVMEQGPSKAMGCLNPLLFCMRNPLHAHDIGTRIKILNQELADICKRGHSFNFIKLEGYHDRKIIQPHVIDRKTDPLLERLAVVGEKIEDDTRVLVEMLTKEVVGESEITVFAIVGIGGIGKTTLSKKVFNNESIQGKFAIKIWLSITQEFDEVDLLRTAIIAANGDLPGPGCGTRDKALLVPALASAIRDTKFFLVLDDMWGNNGWSNLLKAPFSHGAPGSRVLVTTRHETVARGIKALQPYHHVHKLEPEDAWSLLKRQVLTTGKDEPAIEIIKDIGLQILEVCDGVPLAVKVMGGLLCQRDKERHAWEKVLSEAIWSVSQMPEELNFAIFLSYEDLPSSLRQCFLHFSLVPKKKIIQSHEYVGMWIAEGFVHGNSDTLEELANQYYMELIQRNLIEPHPDSIGEYACNMHDVIRSFAHFVARDDTLIAHEGQTTKDKLTLQRFVRLSIENKGVESDGFQWGSLEAQKSLRSLMLFGNIKIQSGDSLAIFSSLRILHIESTNCAAVVESLYHLKHLRYLTLRKCNDLRRLPEKIDKMRFLQHISFEGCENLAELPVSFVKLRELRYLDLDDTCVNIMPRGFCALTNFRKLCGFLAHMDSSWCSLEEIGPLSQLTAIGLVSLDKVPSASFAKKARLSEKAYLSILALYCSQRIGENVQEKNEKDKGIIEEVFDELCPPPCIGYCGRRLPRWMMSAPKTPLNRLRILIFCDLACCTQLPDGMCQLPCLEYLEVNHAPAIKHVGPEFVQVHNHHHCPSPQAVAAFPRLHKMFMGGMVQWEEWMWEEQVQAMPALEELRISECKLRCIPPGLAFHARSLKKLTIWSVEGLNSLENFTSVVELDLFDIPYLTRISNFPKLQKLEIDRCLMVKSLQEMSALRRLVLTVYYNQGLPVYLEFVNPRHLLLDCSPKVVASMALGKSGLEWEKYSHIQHVEAFADDGDIQKKWHLVYTSEPYRLEANICFS